MKQTGYFLIKMKKTLNLYLWSEDKEDLEEVKEKGMEIVPCYKDEAGKEYIKYNDQLIQLK